MARRKDPAAVALGKKSRASLTKEERSASASAAAKARWKDVPLEERLALGRKLVKARKKIKRPSSSRARG